MSHGARVSRSDTRQLIRRSLSPAWNGRMLANSLPSPGRRDRLIPDQPGRMRRRGVRIEDRRNRQRHLPTRLATVTGPQR